jgi:hypothetical protein
MGLTSALIRKLGAGIALCDDDIRAIRSLPIALRRLSAGESIVREGDGATSCCLSVEGFMYRSKNTPDGRRQILSVHIPGDMPDLQSLHLRVMDHDLIAMTGCTACFVPHAARKPLQDNSRTDRLIVPRTSGRTNGSRIHPPTRDSVSIATPRRAPTGGLLCRGVRSLRHVSRLRAGGRRHFSWTALRLFIPIVLAIKSASAAARGVMRTL